MDWAPTSDATTVIELFSQAAEANRATRARRGNVIELSAPDADELLVTADLHGHQRNFDAILTLAALDEHPRRRLVLQEVCHGGPTYPNGGCMSHQLLEQVAALKVAYPEQVHFLLSNHELAELTDYPILKGKRMLNLSMRLGLEVAYHSRADDVRAAYCRFIASCPLAVRLPWGAFISHSLPPEVDYQEFDAGILERPYEMGALDEHGAIFNLVWGRDHREANARAFADAVGAKLLIHGHEPCRDGFMAPNNVQLILDCCTTPACCVLLPVGEELTHEQLVDRVQKLPAA